MRTRLAVLLAGVLALGACADSQDEATPAPTTDDATAGAADTDGATGPELASADLPDGVAATVGDTRITTDEVEQRMALVRELPEVQEQLQGDGAEQAERQIEGEVLGRLVLQRVVLQGAAGEGIEVDDERVEQDIEALREAAGGEEAFAEELADSAVPEAQLVQELRASIAFELVTDELLADAETATDAGTETENTDAATDAATSPGTELDSPSPADPTEQVQQDWLVEVVAETDVVVDEVYGAWDPATGQVVPG